MKRLLPLILVILVVSFSALQAAVDVTVDFVSNTSGQLVFDVNATTDDNAETPEIAAFYLKLHMNAALTSQYISAVGSSRYFSVAAGYSQALTSSGGTEKTLSISYDKFSSPYLTIDGSGGATTLIARITINYNPTDNTGTITKEAVTPLQVIESSDFVTDIAGTVTVNSLTDFPLPVQLASFSADYNKDKVDLNWRTESEIETQGYHIYRSDAVDGDYQCITSALLPAKGSATVAAEYSFTDTFIDIDKTYWYQVQEVTIKGETNVIASTQITTKAPTSMVLQQNYPNPFNPGTKIRYELAIDSHVSLQVFNILGKKIATLVDANQSAGYYSIDWNGLDYNANSISSGVYFYKLEANGTSLIKKMTKVE